MLIPTWRIEKRSAPPKSWTRRGVVHSVDRRQSSTSTALLSASPLKSKTFGFGLIFGLLVVGLQFGSMLGKGSSAAPPAVPPADASSTKPASPTGGPASISPLQVIGSRKCADCHASEYRAWAASTHGGEAFDHLLAPNARKYAQALGIDPLKVTQAERCVRCHGTPQVHRGRFKPLFSVGCEQCHMPAGGESGWLNYHAVYGPTGTPRHLETPEHRAQRLAYVERAGQRGPDDLFGLAERCYSCHVVDDRQLVAAGHPSESTGFEFLSWSSGEVRHNFHMDQWHNADVASLWLNPPGEPAGKRDAIHHRRKMFIIGLLAEMSRHLKARLATEDPGEVNRINTSLAASLGKFSGYAPAANAEILMELNNQLLPLQGLIFQPATPELKEQLQNVIDAVAETARTIQNEMSGSELSGLDGFLQAPPQGTAYEPGI